MKKNNLKKIAKNVIDLEILALRKLKNSINNNFNKVVSLIVNCQSKIIFCGVRYRALFPLGADKGPTFDQKGPAFRPFHGTQRQNWKVLHAACSKKALTALDLQFCLCVPWHRRTVGPFWSKVGPLTAASS